jgi:DNA-binding NtrC family response regulator
VISDSKPSVFVVDDDAIIATTLVIILQRHGYKATSFTGPTEARWQLLEGSRRIY